MEGETCKMNRSHVVRVEESIMIEGRGRKAIGRKVIRGVHIQ